MGFIIAVLLAITAGILVISTPHAAAPGGQIALVAAVDGHIHAAHSHEATVRDGESMGHDHASTWKEGCGGSSQGTHSSGGTDCCNMSACHAFEAVAAFLLHTSCAPGVVVAAVGDEQVEGVFLEGLDRPPRTV
jgi:hypothetical protein